MQLFLISRTKKFYIASTKFYPKSKPEDHEFPANYNQDKRPAIPVSLSLYMCVCNNIYVYIHTYMSVYKTYICIYIISLLILILYT